LRTYQVATVRLTLTQSAPGVAARTLRLTVRYPVVARSGRYRHQSHGLFPLIVFAPGFRHCATVYRDLLRQWSTAGYVVAAVDFPQTSCVTAAPDEADVTHQPADLTFVISRLLARSAAPHGRLAGLIAPGEIAVAGHSDGGDTAAALAGAACCRDPRVAAAVILSGAQWPAFAGSWFARQAPPLLVIQGTADAWNPPADSVRLYAADTTGPRFYLELPGADHFAPYQGDHSPEPIVARVTVAFLDRYLLGQRGQAAAVWRAGKVAGRAVLASAGRLPK
jgi:predicted dienelactone hydrolase